jgi:hypothetical protein
MFGTSLAVAASVALAACSSGTSNTSQHKASQAGQPQADQPGTNPCPPGSCGANINGATTTTAAHVSNASSSNLQAWRAAHLGSLQALSSEASNLLAGAGSTQQVMQACAQLGASTQAAMSAPPPPDPATATRLKTGLTQLAQLASDCTRAFSSGDRVAASRLVYEANQGTATINDVIHRVNGS